MSSEPRRPSRNVVLAGYAAALSAAACLVSCGDVSGLSGSAPVPVVEVLLIAGQANQTALVEYSDPAQPVVAAAHVPVNPDSVHLELVGVDGTHTPFEPVAGSPRIFQATPSVIPGAAYTLSGTVAGVNLTATATVPGTLEIHAPVADSFSFSSSVGDGHIAFSWFAAGANSYLVRQFARDGQATLVVETTDTAGTMLVRPFFDSRADTTSLVIWAYDAAAAAFFLNRGNVPVQSNGAAVVGFGAAVRSPAEKTIVWQP
jgi:hypothetical protein